MNILPVETRVTGFIHYLRQEGYRIGIQETQDAMRMLVSSQLPDELMARNLLRALACRNHDEWTRFDEIFSAYWYPSRKTKTDDDIISTIDPRRKKINRTGIAGIAGATEYMDEIKQHSNMMGSGAGRQRNIAKADFRFLQDRRAAREAEMLAERLAALLQKKAGRKHIIATHGKRIDIRKTLRKNMKYGGLPVAPVYNNRRKELPHLVILHDVSHSMSWNNPLLFRFARGLVRAFPRNAAFAFHTKLFCVTDLYRERSLEIMRERLESKNHLWFGGTCIADSLKFFNDNHAKKQLSRNSIIMIISDGFDTNDPEALAEELQKLKIFAGKIIWLNPVMGRQDYSPDINFMTHAAPHLDLIAPANSLQALEKIIYYLSATVN